MVDVNEIERRVDRAIAAPISVEERGSLNLANLGEVMEFAKLMSVSGAAVPKYLRANPGACLAICTRALRWKMDPFAVAEKSYMVNNRGEERIAYEAQLVNAVVLAHAPLKNRLRDEIVGEGDERRCRVWGTFNGEDKPHEYISETLKALRDARGRNDQGTLKGSPLWDTQPEVQLRYSAVRQWCRLYSPETLLGVYVPEELDGEPIDVTPPATITSLAQRLRDKRIENARGFDAERIAREGRQVIDGEAEETTANESTGTSGQPDVRGGQGQDTSGAGGDRQQGGGDAVGGAADQAGGQPAGQEAAPAQGKDNGTKSEKAAKPKAKR